jgi:hypothetical protein
MEFDLEKFLRNHKPAKVDFSPYLKLEKLKGYRLLKWNQLDKLKNSVTYVKYMKESQAFSDKEYKTHVHCGGFFIAGGTYIDGKFKRMKHLKDWTHLLLKRQPLPVGKELTDKGFGFKNVYEYEIHVFTTRIGGNYIFYKYSDEEL